jgi:hypothetical protein
VGSSGYGTIKATPVGCGSCLAPATASIPVITHNAPISGQSTICVGNPVYFSLPLWPGAAYSWSVVNAVPSHSAFILSVTDDYKVLVEGYSTGTFVLNVYYSDIVAGCSDSSSMTVVISDLVTDQPSPAIGCAGYPATFTLSDTARSAWVISGPSNIFDTISGPLNSVTYTPPVPGTYTVTVTNPNVCVNAPLTYIVDATPSVTDTLISGTDTVCRNTPYTYTAKIPAPSGVQYTWSLPNPSDGTIVGANTGNSVIVKWAATTTGTLRISAQSTVNASCIDTAGGYYTVYIIKPNAAFNYPHSVCANNVSTAVSAVSSEEDFYTWTFTPSNLASCVSGYEHSMHPQIQYNNVTVPTYVVVTLTVTRCNTSAHTNDSVLILPPPTVTVSGGDTDCVQSFTAAISPSLPGTTYTWTLSDGTLVSTGTSNTLGYTFTQGGPYWIRVTAYYTDSCTGSVNSANDSFVVSNGCVPTYTGSGGSSGSPCVLGYSSTFRCNSANTGYVLKLSGNPGYAGGTGYTWSVSPAISGQTSFSGQVVSIAGAAIGTAYSVTMTATESGQTCSVSFVTDTVPALPSAAFYYEDSSLYNSSSFPHYTNHSKICEGYSITLQPVLPQNPNWIYYWHDNHDFADIVAYNPPKEYSITGTSNISSNITLNVTDQYGCVATHSDTNFTVVVNQLAGQVGPTTGPGHLVQLENASYICPNSSNADTFDYQLPIGSLGNPNHWNWYNAANPNQNLSRLPRPLIAGLDGRYLCIVTDSNGCEQISGQAGVIQTLTMPPVSINSNSTYCVGDTVRLSVVRYPNVGYNWSIPGVGTDTGIAWSIPNLHTGTYIVTLSYTDTFPNTGTPSLICSQLVTDTFVIDTIPTVTALIDSSRFSCDPYNIGLTAIGTPSNISNYYWSNGASTQSTTVAAGGDYRVWLTGPGHCVAHSDILVPDDPSVLIQYAPYGCYTYSCSTLTTIGVQLTGPPSTSFVAWSWNLSGQPITGYTGTNSPVAPYTAYAAGDYSLTLYEAAGQDTCAATSALMHISASDVPCHYCDLHLLEKVTCALTDNFFITVVNSSYSPASYTITSSSGTFVGLSPAVIGFDTTDITATFVPNLGVSGNAFIVVTLVDSSGNSCQDTASFHLPTCESEHKELGTKDSSGVQIAKMLLLPNPASDMVNVVYSTGPGSGPLPAGERLDLVITDVSGQEAGLQTLSNISGMVTLDVSGLRPGMYTVSLMKNQNPVATDKLEVTAHK